MKQIEVRLAVVLYGGVSLAVYIHGVTREILNLVRASKLFRLAQSRAISDSDLDVQRPEGDSTAIYYDLFRALSPGIELRVVVDLISGASAGGINGVMLARALAHDLPLEPHRDLWLKNADVTSLSAPGNWLGRLGKAPLAPLIDPNLHSCGSVPPHGVVELTHPEPNFYIVGSKVYGRAPTFLMATGYEQVRSVIAELAGDHEAARRVELVLPETGVCSTTPAAVAKAQTCCGAAA